MSVNITPTESDDVKKVDRAIQAILRSDRTTARRLLEEVVANCPNEYVNRYIEDNCEYIKFWDRHEFFTYVTEPKEEHGYEQTVWIGNAYPRAYFYLAYLAVENENYEEALAHLEVSLKLEPNQPASLCEMANIYGGMRQPEKAIELYDRVIHAHFKVTTHFKAAALRGKGVQLIELGELDLAEQYLSESLQYEQSSKLALSELEYIERLRSGEEHLPFFIGKSSQRTCALCGKNLSLSYRVVNAEGKVLSICNHCNRKQP